MEIAGWTYDEIHLLAQATCNEHDVLKFVLVHNLEVSGTPGKRNLYVVFVERDGEPGGFRYFPSDAFDEADASFQKRAKLADPKAVAAEYNLFEMRLSGIETPVAQFGKKGKITKIKRNQGFYFVDCDGRRTQNLLSADAIVCYLANACEDGTSFGV
jgi:hypothetical protein